MKIRNYILTALLLATISTRGLANAQVPDILIYNGDTLSIYANPLESLNNIDSLRKELFGLKESYWHTSCYREYIAEWTIIDKQLYLTAIYNCNYPENPLQADLKQLFQGKYENGKVKADWLTGNILSPQGKQLYYVHAAYASLYEKEVVYSFVNGQLNGTTIYDNSKSHISKYSEQKALQDFIYTNIDWDNLPELEQTIKVMVRFSANEQGKIDSVEILRKSTEPFNTEAIRVMKSIPEWDVYYRHGQFERRPWHMPIIFSEENRAKYKKD